MRKLTIISILTTLAVFLVLSGTAKANVTAKKNGTTAAHLSSKSKKTLTNAATTWQQASPKDRGGRAQERRAPTCHGESEARAW